MMDDIYNDRSLDCDQTEECAEKYQRFFLKDLEDLYNHEINFRISCFWDGGFDVFIGDDLNGYIWKDSTDNIWDAFKLLKNKIKEMMVK